MGVRVKGDFNRIQKFLNRMRGRPYLNVLDVCAQMGLEALKHNTPVDSGETARSWRYTIEYDRYKTTISWENTHINDGVNVALILQYGHGAADGSYVRGIDYINPAIRPYFLEIADLAWEEVSKA